eukprot:3918807-Prymnesium_polylepis.1
MARRDLQQRRHAVGGGELSAGVWRGAEGEEEERRLLLDLVVPGDLSRCDRARGRRCERACPCLSVPVRAGLCRSVLPRALR